MRRPDCLEGDRHHADRADLSGRYAATAQCAHSRRLNFPSTPNGKSGHQAPHFLRLSWPSRRLQYSRRLATVAVFDCFGRMAAVLDRIPVTLALRLDPGIADGPGHLAARPWPALRFASVSP